MAPRNRQTETEAPAGPVRTATATAIPKRGSDRQTNTYPEYAPEINELKANLGQAYEYANTGKANTIAQGLRRVYGVNASTRNVDKATQVGTLWLQWPCIDNGDGTFSEDADKVAENLEKYAK